MYTDFCKGPNLRLWYQKYLKKSNFLHSAFIGLEKILILFYLLQIILLFSV